MAAAGLSRRVNGNESAISRQVLRPVSVAHFSMSASAWFRSTHGQPMAESATLGRKRPYTWDHDLQSSDRTSQYVDAVHEAEAHSSPRRDENALDRYAGSSTACRGGHGEVLNGWRLVIESYADRNRIMGDEEIHKSIQERLKKEHGDINRIQNHEAPDWFGDGWLVSFEVPRHASEEMPIVSRRLFSE